MLNEGCHVAEDVKVLEGIELVGRVNVDDDGLIANITSAIRRGLPQIKPHPPKPDRVCLVGGGPSLESTLPELRELIFEGAKLVTVNGAYRWCIEHNLQPRTQIVMDARAHNARFLTPYVPECRYVLASQCHPAIFDAVQDYPDVWLFHAASGTDGDLKALLDAFYRKQWFGVGGGTTVITRALSLLRTLGYLRFDFFGVDSCWLDGRNHAYEQPENARDRRMPFKIHPSGEPEKAHIFWCAPWHVKQLEDFVQMIRVNAEHFKINVHGNGLLAYALQASANMEWAPVTLPDSPLSLEPAHGSTSLENL